MFCKVLAELEIIKPSKTWLWEKSSALYFYIIKQRRR